MGTIGIYTTVEAGGYLIAASLLLFRRLVRVLPEGLVSQGYELTRSFLRLISDRNQSKAVSSVQTKSSVEPSLHGGSRDQTVGFGDTVALTGLQQQPEPSYTTFAGVGALHDSRASIDERDDMPDSVPRQTPGNAIKVYREVDVTHEGLPWSQ